MLRLRAHFAAEGSRAKEYRPWRPQGLPAKVAAVANFKGGVGKTSTAAHLAMSAALDGYRVLVVDLDSQGSMTSLFGGRVADEWGTVFPLVARDYALGLREENRRRVERGDPPQPFDELLETALAKTTQDVIQKTHWPNIDLVGAQLNLYWAEFQIPVWRMAFRGWKLWDALGRALARDGVLDAYDLVILDTPPALGYLTINGLAAADILLVPLGASFLEFDSTGRFFDMLAATFASIEDGENLAARALGRPEVHFEWDAVRAVITRYDPSQQAELASLMTAWMGGRLAPWRQDFTALVGQAGEQAGGIYEADYRDFNRETYARGRQTFDETYAAFKRLLLASWRRDEKEAAAAAREGDRLMARRRLAPLPAADAPTFRARNTRPRCARRASPPPRSPASPPRPPAPRRCRSSPTPWPAPARPAGWSSTCRSTPSPPTTWPGTGSATGCRPTTRTWAPCASRSAPTASAPRSRSWR